MKKLVKDEGPMCYKHDGVWQCMMHRNKLKLKELCSKGDALWNLWMD